MIKVWPAHTHQKIIDPDDMEKVANQLRQEGKTIATLNGSFDLLHAGHLKVIHEAKKQADVLFMALNSDESIKQYKSSTRPIIPLQYRLEMISALQDVDYVTWFHELDPKLLISRIRPDVHVNGSEYGTDCIEAEVVKEVGARLHIVKLVPGLSTSNIIDKIKQI